MSIILSNNFQLIITYLVTKVHLFLDRSSFKIVVIFNNTSAEIKTKWANVSSKMTMILKETRIAQLLSKNKQTLGMRILNSKNHLIFLIKKVEMYYFCHELDASWTDFIENYSYLRNCKLFIAKEICIDDTYLDK